MAVLVKMIFVTVFFSFVGCANSIDFIEGSPCEVTDNCVYEYCAPEECVDYICAKYNPSDSYYYCQKKSEVDLNDTSLIAPEYPSEEQTNPSEDEKYY